MNKQKQLELLKQQQQNLTINNFYIQKVQKQSQVVKQQPQVNILQTDGSKYQNYLKLHDVIGNSTQQIETKRKPQFQANPMPTQVQLNQILSKQTTKLLINQVIYKYFSQRPIRPSAVQISTPVSVAKNSYSPYLRNSSRNSRAAVKIEQYYPKDQIQQRLSQTNTNSPSKPLPNTQQQSRINNTTNSVINGIIYIQQNNHIQAKQKEYKNVSHSLNGSFELIQRRQKTNLEAPKQTNFDINQTRKINIRAQSVADSFKVLPPETAKLPKVCRMDSETSFEGYRKSERFLTMNSQDDIDNLDMLDEFSVRDFLKNKPMSRFMIEHFLNVLDSEQIQLVDKLVGYKKKELTNRRSNSIVMKSTSRQRKF